MLYSRDHHVWQGVLSSPRFMLNEAAGRRDVATGTQDLKERMGRHIPARLTS
jgi:hypothetical protein